MAQIQWGTKTPGHIIYLIDQSGSMSGANEQKAAVIDSAAFCSLAPDIEPDWSIK